MSSPVFDALNERARAARLAHQSSILELISAATHRARWPARARAV